MITPLEPKEVQILISEGVEKTFILSKFPAVAGREIVTQYPFSGLPKVGDYATNEEIMLKIMTYVSAVTDGGTVPLVTREAINNHVPDFEVLIRIEWAMMEYNCSFFRNGKASTFLDDILAKLQASISLMLIPLLDQSSERDTPPSTN